MTPIVSVVMPVFNAGTYLAQAIESILNQTFVDFELVIVNDGSTDCSAEIIGQFNDSRIVTIDQQNQGVAIALNNGIRASRGTYIARMDADDIAYPHRLRVQVEQMDTHPGIALLGSNARIIDNAGNYVYTSNVPTQWTVIEKQLPFVGLYHSSAMYRRDQALKAGLYDERLSTLNSFEDQILWNKLTLYGKIENLSEPLIKYRLQPNAVTSKSSEEGTLVRKIIPQLISGTNFPDAEVKELLRVKKAMTPTKKHYFYYIHLAKKHLLEGNNRTKSFACLIKAFGFMPLGKELAFYLVMLVLPHGILKKIQKK